MYSLHGMAEKPLVKASVRPLLEESGFDHRQQPCSTCTLSRCIVETLLHGGLARTSTRRLTARTEMLRSTSPSTGTCFRNEGMPVRGSMHG